MPGLPDFYWCNKSKLGKIYQNARKLPNGLILYQNGNKNPTKYTKNSILRYCKIYRYWHFWYENLPSGNPANEMLPSKNVFQNENDKILLAAVKMHRYTSLLPQCRVPHWANFRLLGNC
jgi:hypothetical protein